MAKTQGRFYLEADEKALVRGALRRDAPGLTVPAWAAADFVDAADHWAIADIRWARENGVVDGVGNNRFDPEGTVANNAMVKMLVGAFFREEFNAYEQEYRQVIDIYFGGDPGWGGAMNYYALRNGLLDNVSMSIDRPASAGASMTRNDMAMILYNAAAKKGLTASESGKSAAQASIKDYNSIPATHREAVTTCFALKLLNGDNGSFLGANTVTRAQACAVLHRMANLLGSGTGADPNPAEPTVKEILVTTKAEANNSTSYSVADNTVQHAMIVTILHQSGSYLFCAEGDHSSVVKWPKYTGSWNAFGPTELSVYGSCIALSRWPD